MFEIELFLGGISFGLLLAYLIIPRILMPKLRERFESDEKAVKRTFKYECPECHSGGRHRNDCPNNPKNKVKT